MEAIESTAYDVFLDLAEIEELDRRQSLLEEKCGHDETLKEAVLALLEIDAGIAPTF